MNFFSTYRGIREARGFTLIEVLVSVSIFAMVMLVATGAVFSIVQANKKTHSLKSVMTNLNFALEAMMRDIRLGSTFICDSGPDCTNGGTQFRFLANRNVNGDSITDSTDIIVYSMSGGAIMKQILGGTYGGASSAITAAEITVTSLKFYVIGAGTTDTRQPKVIISIQGYSGVGNTQSNFNIQTMVSQRAIDS